MGKGPILFLLNHGQHMMGLNTQTSSLIPVGDAKAVDDVLQQSIIDPDCIILNASQDASSDRRGPHQSPSQCPLCPKDVLPHHTGLQEGDLHQGRRAGEQQSRTRLSFLEKLT